MNEGKKKRIFVLLWILIIMMTYYSTTNVNFSEQNVTKSKMEILEKPQSPKEIYRAKTISERSIYGENVIDNLFSEKGEKSVYATRNIYKDSKGNVLEYDTTSLIYSTAVYQKISNSISREKLERCSNDKDLSFAPREAVQEEINTILEDMKIPTENLVYSCYVVSPNAIEQKDIVSSSRKGKDGYYFFAIRQIIDEKPVIFQFLDTYISVTPSTAPIQILYSSGGIEYMSISDLYDIDTELNSEKLIPFSSINEKISYKYSQLINSSSYKMKDVEFGYFILNCGKRKELVPVWVIFIKETTKEKEYEYQELYNALTGEEIVL